MNNFFYLPSTGNHITAEDVKKGALRITVHAKHFFSGDQPTITVMIKGIPQQVRYVKRGKKSDILHLGKALTEALNLQAGDKLKIIKTQEDIFIIEPDFPGFRAQETDNITLAQLHWLKTKYWQLLEEHPFPKPPQDGECANMIRYFKRTNAEKDNRIGPYIGISVFEAANRIASDLVIINGIIQLISEGLEPEDAIITVRLGNKHIKGKGDFTINNKEGEAFNVAASFYKVKLGMTSKKWQDTELSYILVNGDVFKELTKQNTYSRSKIIRVKDWDIK